MSPTETKRPKVDPSRQPLSVAVTALNMLADMQDPEAMRHVARTALAFIAVEVSRQ